ncbi:hypothetical protein [Paenirhodobacter populi]|uniref:Uncharacterized protein n=1 Tax=Paenirhodobacter populi TaxID=2306993 RepID=A0A443JC18_9RHOB|nr:hypothetical protein [Sinirhodobacter populi]RWR18020.1 hypothetical protein D2T30_17415 [Sinirhodobacter populi]
MAPTRIKAPGVQRNLMIDLLGGDPVHLAQTERLYQLDALHMIRLDGQGPDFAGNLQMLPGLAPRSTAPPDPAAMWAHGARR